MATKVTLTITLTSQEDNVPIDRDAIEFEVGSAIGSLAQATYPLGELDSWNLNIHVEKEA
jgi:hypothetical protein